MSSYPNAVNLTLQLIPGADIDPEQLDYITRQLRDEIRDVDVESVELIREGTVPEGAKVAEVVTLGALAIAVLPAALPKLMDVVRDWLMRGENRKVKIKTTVGDRSVEVDYSPETISKAELKDLVDTLTNSVVRQKHRAK
jgi:hypothetical protein